MSGIKKSSILATTDLGHPQRNSSQVIIDLSITQSVHSSINQALTQKQPLTQNPN